MTQHIGIAACSAEGAALCYRTICTEAALCLGKYDHPEITMHTPPFDKYMRCFERDDWNGVAELMLTSTEKLEKAGADFVICPDNTIHRAFELVAEKSPLPWLHIAQEVAFEAARRNYSRLGILGTKYLVESDVYSSKLEPQDISHSIPETTERERIHEIIFTELIYGRFTQESRAYFVEVINRMKQRGCHAVVLGCTEIPLLISERNSPLPTLDSTRILARAALRRAMQAPLAQQKSNRNRRDRRKIL